MWKRLDAKPVADEKEPIQKNGDEELKNEPTVVVKQDLKQDQKQDQTHKHTTQKIGSVKLGEIKHKKPYDRKNKSPKDEWDPKHFRLFVGNLGPAVTTEVLSEAFAKFKSLAKTRVIFDKRTQKSKGYGFVAFADSKDYLEAFQTMNNKYIGSQPVTLKRARPIDN